MSDVLAALRDVIWADPGRRGLATVPGDNLLTACPADLASARQSVAWNRGARLAVVTGFFIPRATPPAGETDGPLGALFLARALTPAGVGLTLATDDPAYRKGLAFLIAGQGDDGTWRVASRSKAFQPYFESGFPHGKDQFISMAGSSWAVTALALACPEPAGR